MYLLSIGVAHNTHLYTLMSTFTHTWGLNGEEGGAGGSAHEVFKQCAVYVCVQLGTIAAFRQVLIYLRWAYSIWKRPQWLTDGKRKKFQCSGHNGSAVVAKRREENRVPCDFPTFHSHPSLLFFPPLFCAWIFYLFYSLGTLQSNKPPSFSPVLDLEPKLETAWLEQRGGSQERGRCGYWTGQIAPLQSAFYPRTPRLKYPHPSPSNHGSGCFPLIIYLVTRWCFLP